jgi:hypothetical protein
MLSPVRGDSHGLHPTSWSEDIAFTEVLRIERLGLAPFVEAGTLAGSLEALPRAWVHADYGIGFHMALERNAMFRVDAGVSNEGPNFSVAFGLSF